MAGEEGLTLNDAIAALLGAAAAELATQENTIQAAIDVMDQLPVSASTTAILYKVANLLEQADASSPDQRLALQRIVAKLSSP